MIHFGHPVTHQVKGPGVWLCQDGDLHEIAYPGTWDGKPGGWHSEACKREEFTVDTP